MYAVSLSPDIFQHLRRPCVSLHVYWNGSLQLLDWNGGLEWWNGTEELQIQQKMRSKGHNIVKYLVENFGIQVDANNKFNAR